MPQTALLTLVGPGGVGETRLALEAASVLTDRFADGIWWVDLAGFADPALLPQMIAAAAGMGDGAEEAPATVLIDALRTRRALLLLDNCEHLVGACAAAADDLLRGCRELLDATSSCALLARSPSPAATCRRRRNGSTRRCPGARERLR